MEHFLYRRIASKVQAVANCVASSNNEWLDRHTADVAQMVADFMPSGSGIDQGTKFEWDRSTSERLVFRTAFHHMNGAGMYDGWTEHFVTVTPSLAFGIELKISGQDRNDVKELLHQVFYDALTMVLAP